jgi:hypothetical protein
MLVGKRQPHSCGYDGQARDTLYPDNGGISGASYWPKRRSPGNSEVHSAQLCGQALTSSCSLYRLGGAYSSSSTFFFIEQDYSQIAGIVKDNQSRLKIAS